MININRLIDNFPHAVEINGIEYEINTDFRDCLYTIEQIQNPNFYPEEKIDILIHNMYLIVNDPEDENLDLDNLIYSEEAIKKAWWFLRCGKNENEKKEPTLFDFSKDDSLIYEAFFKANIELENMNWHWWKFIARFSELPESRFSRIIYLRSQMARNKLSKDERIEINRIGEDVVILKTPIDDAEDEIIQAAAQGREEI